MRKLLTICALSAALSRLGLAETWNGTLMDADCASHHHTTKTFDAKRSTTAFLLDVNGTKCRLDSKSNDRARSVMEARSDKASNPEATKSVPVTAKVTGRMRSHNKIHAETIEVQ